MSDLIEYVPTPYSNQFSLFRFACRHLTGIRIRCIRWWRKVRWVLEKMWLLTPLNVRAVSSIIERVIERKVDLRPLFCPRDAVFSCIPVSKEHTHQDAARNRTSANIFLNTLVTKAGYEPYNVSRSNHDMYGGNRYFYCIKDMATPYRDDEIRDNTAFIFTDVDYYCDINLWLKHHRPMLMYTLVPTTVAGRGPDYAYSIENDLVKFVVSGGAEYQHPLWDYCGDTVSVIDDDGALCSFSIEQKILPGDKNRRLIWLLPTTRVPGPYWAWLFEPTSIKRKTFSDDGGKRNVIFEPITDTVSVAANGAHHSVELPGSVYNAIRRRINHKTTPPVVADIERLLLSNNVPEPSVKAPVLFDLIGAGPFVPNIVRTTEMFAHFQPLGPLATEDGKTTGAICGNTLVTNPAVFPIRSYNSDVSTIDGRITRVKNTITPGRKYVIWAQEFIRELVPIAGKGCPISVEDVRKLQNAPAQISRFEQVKHLLGVTPTNRLECFIKAEPYMGTNDPRNITTMSPELTTMMSCFTYAFKQDVLKHHNWYGPCKTPKKITERLRELAGGDMISTDYSRFDGTISKFLVDNIIKAAYLRWCSEEHRTELEGWFRAMYKKTGTTANGLKFQPGYSTRSGGPTTTDGNTIVTLFPQYCSLRTLGYAHSEAWSKVGIAYGDDGGMKCHSPDLPSALELCASDLGLKLKSVVVESGVPFPFLGRFFVDLRAMNDSFQDPLRTLTKLHLTSNKGVTPAQALCNKAHGYVNTDALTPIIGAWCHKVIGTYKLKFKGATKEEQFKRSYAWQQSNADAIREACATVMEMSVADLRQFEAMVENTALDQLPMLIDNSVTNKCLAVLGDAIVEPGRPSGITCTTFPSIHHERQPEATPVRARTPKSSSEDCIANSDGATTGQAARVLPKEAGNGPSRRPTRSGTHNHHPLETRGPHQQRGGHRGRGSPPSRGGQRRSQSSATR
jgi:hypothetical protein